MESTHVTVDRLLSRINDVEEDLNRIRKMSLEEAAVFYTIFRAEFDYLDEVRNKWASVKEQLSSKIMPEIFEQSQQDQSIKLKTGLTVTVSYKTLASIKDKPGAYKWLEENDLGDLIQPTVNASTLASVAKGLIEENQSLPPELFNVTLKPTTSIVKSRGK